MIGLNCRRGPGEFSPGAVNIERSEAVLPWGFFLELTKRHLSVRTAPRRVPRLLTEQVGLGCIETFRQGTPASADIQIQQREIVVGTFGLTWLPAIIAPRKSSIHMSSYNRLK